MSERAVAVVVYDGCLLTIHRQKAGRDYYVLPGGGIEPGETPAGACAREVQEETGLTVTIARELCVLANRGRVEHYFLAHTLGGGLVLGGPERERQGPDNCYTPEWVNAPGLAQINLQPEAIRPWCAESLREASAQG